MDRRVLAASLACLLLGACGSPPSGPGPVTPPPPPPPVNQPPQIESVTVSTNRTEVDTSVTVTATVRDPETPIEQLGFEWLADAGAFSGQGPSVTWTVPKGAPTPNDYAVTVTVTETYGPANAQGVRSSNVVKASSSAVRVHDSPRELSELSMRFLSDFANSAVPASTAVREFTDSCGGKAEERIDIEENRIKFEILSSSLSMKNVSVSSDRQRANTTVACTFTSKRVKCLPNDPPSCRVGDVGTVTGDCLLTERYEQNRWWLCTSGFDGRVTGSLRGFFGRQ